MSNGRIDSSINVPAIEAEFKKLFALYDETVRRLTQLSTLAAGIDLSGRRSGNKTRDAIKAADDLDAALKRLEKAESDVGKQIAIVNEKARQQGVLNRQAAKENLANATSIDGLQARLNALTRQYDMLSAAERRSKTEGGALLTQIKALRQEVGALELETGRAQRNVGNYPKQLVGGLSGLLGTLGIATGGAAIAKQIFDTTVQLDSLNAALRAVSGTEAEFIRNQIFLAETSDRLGLNLLDLTQSYKLFYAASTQAGLSADTTRSIFNSVSEAAAVLKLSTQDTQGVLLAFSQILGKGKVQAEELRGQIGERLPGAFSIAARSIGVTEQQLNKMLEKGEVIASEFLPKFAAELEKTFGVEGEQRVEGLQAAVNRLSNTFTKLISDNQSGLTKFFASIVTLADKALQGVNALSTGFAFLYNTLTDPAAADKQLQEKNLNELRKLADNSTIEAVLERRNLVDVALEAEEERLERIQQNYDQLLKSEKTDANAVRTYRTKRILQDQIDQVDFLKKQREILVSALKQKLPGTDTPASAGGTPTGLSEAELNKQSRLREMQLKAILDARKIDLETAAEASKTIAEDEKKSLLERLSALADYNTLRNMQVSASAEYEKKILDENIKQGQAVAEQQIVLDKDTARKREQILKDTGKIQKDILKDTATGRIGEVLKGAAEESAQLERQALAEQEQLQKLYASSNMSLEQFELAQLQIKNKYATLQLQTEIEATKKILEIRKLRGEDVSQEEAKLAQLENQLLELGLELFKKNEQEKTKTKEEEAAKRKQIEEQMHEKLMELGKEAVNFFWTLAGARFENEKNQIADLIEENTAWKNAEIERINATGASAEEKAARIKVVEAQAQAQQEALEARRREIQIRQAQFERAQAIASIIVNTAAAVVKALPIVPLAAAVAAIGAVQLATALATPLPRYKMGRNGGRAEWAVVGDGGVNEVVESRSGAYMTPDKDTLTYLPEGAKVHRSVEAYLSSKNRSANRQAPGLEVDGSGRLQIRRDLEQQTEKLTAAMERNKSTMNVYHTWAGVTATLENAAGYLKYVQHNVRL